MRGRKEAMALDWYPVVQEGGIPTTDLEVQLVWLHALETRDLLTAEELAAEWLDHYLPNWDEYGFSKTNVRRACCPSLRRVEQLVFREHGRPSARRIWACVAPGLPLLAARLAREDAIVDHTDESAYAEMLFAVIESAAFVEEDRDRLIALGLAAIPDESRVARAVRVMQETWQRTGSWEATRQAILDAEGRWNFTDAPPEYRVHAPGMINRPPISARRSVIRSTAAMTPTAPARRWAPSSARPGAHGASRSAG